MLARRSAQPTRLRTGGAAHPQYANYWAPLTRKRHTPPHPAQPQHTNHWAPRTRKRHQQEHRPQRPTESSDPTQHAKGRTGDRPGPVKEQQPDGVSHRVGGGGMARATWALLPHLHPEQCPWAWAHFFLEPTYGTGLSSQGLLRRRGRCLLMEGCSSNAQPFAIANSVRIAAAAAAIEENRSGTPSEGFTALTCSRPAACSPGLRVSKRHFPVPSWV